ncbi:hypothetical protein A5707_13350 [Mycobacterium kyorinense]|uniref:Uncharacterized protein n=1 Tax=Mycobacterium kyorinense TaxID=487514 RepID=A0A1A2ZRK4_9MYCO|nr:hypothetical protein [Mycobacterium kyorinense]OBI51696.1 hypothetical protein A5707_13350 [Mycobacterium kyorinense]
MGILYGFAPWIVFWVLVGNVPFGTSVLVGLAVALVAALVGWGRRMPVRTFEIGTVVIFLVLAVVTFTCGQPFLERWIQPLSCAGIFLVALVGVLVGKPFVRELAEIDQPADAVKSEPFGRLTRLLTWIWIAVFAAMTVSALIPPIVDRDATLFDAKTPATFLCYWVIPFALLALGALTARILSDRLGTEVDNAPRKTTFVAYDEATIDELYYLAQQHANREVGSGKEAYDVKVGGLGTPLVGDDSRKSWPATYKVREGRH